MGVDAAGDEEDEAMVPNRALRASRASVFVSLIFLGGPVGCPASSVLEANFTIRLAVGRAAEVAGLEVSLSRLRFRLARTLAIEGADEDADEDEDAGPDNGLDGEGATGDGAVALLVAVGGVTAVCFDALTCSLTILHTLSTNAANSSSVGVVGSSSLISSCNCCFGRF